MSDFDARQKVINQRRADLKKQHESIKEALLRNSKKPDLMEYTNFEYNRLHDRRDLIEAELEKVEHDQAALDHEKTAVG